MKLNVAIIKNKILFIRRLINEKNKIKQFLIRLRKIINNLIAK